MNARTCFWARLALIFLVLSSSLATFGQMPDLPSYRSPFMRVEMSRGYPGFAVLAFDSLGKNKLDKNLLKNGSAISSNLFSANHAGNMIEYRFAGMPLTDLPAWSFDFSSKQMRLRSFYSKSQIPPPLSFVFEPETSHATLLGLTAGEGLVKIPAILHFPDFGTLRITSAPPDIKIGYDALRYPDHSKNQDYIRITLPAATEERPSVEYILEVAAIHPELPADFKEDPRFDGFRRNWLSIFQLNPRLNVLANNATSDPCAFTVFMYSSMAKHTPPLAPGLTALDLVRQTLNRYLEGMKAYGMAGYSQHDTTTYLDTYPSLLMAAYDYVHGSQDWEWLDINYSKLKAWTDTMLKTDKNGNGLLEYVYSGNSGSWPRVENPMMRPSNWWDTIGFGHEDAYANALAYRALLGMAELSLLSGNLESAELYENRATKIRRAYLDAFYNPATNVLAGWKSEDGQLHDYYFLFVNGAAITYGLVTEEQGRRIMDRLLEKMKEVGYDKFEYGLPGNLIPIRQVDYTHLIKRWGGPETEDGSDGFQIYENGGATASFAYFTLEALYKLGRRQDGDMIMIPMLQSFENGGFQGRGPNGMTYDWKAWDGTPHGYEGLLVDGFQALLAFLQR